MKISTIYIFIHYKKNNTITISSSIDHIIKKAIHLNVFQVIRNPSATIHY